MHSIIEQSCKFVGLTCVLLTAGLAWAGFQDTPATTAGEPLTAWRWMQSVTLPAQKGASPLADFVLTSIVFDLARVDLNDLRPGAPEIRTLNEVRSVREGHIPSLRRSDPRKRIPPVRRMGIGSVARPGCWVKGSASSLRPYWCSYTARSCRRWSYYSPRCRSSGPRNPQTNWPRQALRVACR